ncbi:MAG: hypothetical protein H6699_04480 [Myxococcales bacterium]|nr:hypothetical protein [Myxococcales bacterium]
MTDSVDAAGDSAHTEMMNRVVAAVLVLSAAACGGAPVGPRGAAQSAEPSACVTLAEGVRGHRELPPSLVGPFERGDFVVAGGEAEALLDSARAEAAGSMREPATPAQARQYLYRWVYDPAAPLDVGFDRLALRRDLALRLTAESARAGDLAVAERWLREVEQTGVDAGVTACAAALRGSP